MRLFSFFWRAMLGILLSPVAQADLVDVSPFISANGRYIEFHLENHSGRTVICTSIKQKVKYISKSTMQVVGTRPVGLFNVTIRSGDLAFKQEAGKDHIEAIAATTPDAVIGDFVGDVVSDCEFGGDFETWGVGHNGPVDAIVVVPGEAQIVSVGGTTKTMRGWCNGKTMVTWDVKTRARQGLVHELSCPNQTPAFPFLVPTPRGAIGAWGSAPTFLNVETDEVVGGPSPVDDEQVLHADIFANRRVAVVATSTGLRELSLSNVLLGKVLISANVTFVKGLPDGKRVLGISREGATAVYDLFAGSSRGLGPTDGRFIAFDVQTNTVLFHQVGLRKLTAVDLDSGETRSLVSTKVPTGMIVRPEDFHLAENGSLLFRFLRGEDGCLGLLDTKTGAYQSEFCFRSGGGPQATSQKMAVSQDGRTVYLGMDNGTIKSIRLPR